ncbi:A2L zinc ribbon protein [Anaerobacterium chartisolvens]|uniref:A2L zinc ribbon protein n=1 Tax=Anaerobacterium chartisolvens TaxID=1297424 RepID=A0A369AST6_9FIRM|nr:zinc-ribbon domain-containing protein [Anaerobacterium chartisolvens]RCX10524.1 A2L zinc ribbon protein [Anaerobacterium chartisolvens]
MSVFESITRKVSDTAKAAAKKSGELVEVTKLNMNISAEEDKIRKAYADIGKMVYNTYSKVGEVGEEYKGLCEAIKGYEEVIAETRQKILDLKNLKVCTGCGADLEQDILFCPKCGAKQ